MAKAAIYVHKNSGTWQDEFYCAPCAESLPNSVTLDGIYAYRVNGDQVRCHKCGFWIEEPTTGRASFFSGHKSNL